MKIKRFVDTDMRQVLRRVREDQGPDAVILSNRRVAEGIEVIAAVDYDEALMQQALGSAPADAATSAPVNAAAETKSDKTRAANPSTRKKKEADPVRVVASQLEAKAGDAERRPGEAETTVGKPTPTTSEQDGGQPSRDNGDTAMESLQREVSNMRGILETQLSALLWKETQAKSPTRVQILRNLTRIGVGPDIANQIANRLGPVEDSRDLWRAPLLELARCLPIATDDLLSEGGVAALVGPTGVGKTTTIAKLAIRYAMQHGAGSVALVSADAHRVGAQEHLATFAKLLGVPVYPAEDQRALEDLLDHLDDKALVLVDTEGTSQRDVDLSARLAAFGNNEERVRFYLTLAATCQEAGIDETIRVFKRVPLAGAVITKVDEAAQLGCVMGALIRHGLPAAYVTDGQRVPDDLYPAARKRLWFVNQAVESMRSSGVKVSEDMMAQRFAMAGAAHA